MGTAHAKTSRANAQSNEAGAQKKCTPMPPRGVRQRSPHPARTPTISLVRDTLPSATKERAHLHHHRPVAQVRLHLAVLQRAALARHADQVPNRLRAITALRQLHRLLQAARATLLMTPINAFTSGSSIHAVGIPWRVKLETIAAAGSIGTPPGRNPSNCVGTRESRCVLPCLRSSGGRHRRRPRTHRDD